MSPYPNLDKEKQFFKVKTRDDEIKNLKYHRENTIMRKSTNLLKLIMNIIRGNINQLPERDYF